MELDEILKSPSQHFASPDDVLADGRFTREQKLAILESWEAEAQQLQVATEENMGGGEQMDLNVIHEALRQLRDT